MRRVSNAEHRLVWRPLIRVGLPEPFYYWLLDKFASNQGWRPLLYSHCQHDWIYSPRSIGGWGLVTCGKCQKQDIY